MCESVGLVALGLVLGAALLAYNARRGRWPKGDRGAAAALLTLAAIALIAGALAPVGDWTDAALLIVGGLVLLGALAEVVSWRGRRSS
jgi:hypothetical protein